METLMMLDEHKAQRLQKNEMLDLGCPALNHITDCFLKAAGVGVVQSVSRHAYSTFTEENRMDTGGLRPETTGSKKLIFPNLKGETIGKSLEAWLKNTGKESLQWGLAAGMYSGVSYGLKEAWGTHDWKNSAVAGAVTGMALALTTDGPSHEQVVQSAITGAAISTVANLLAGADVLPWTYIICQESSSIPSS